jgi:diadenylate cyclase
MDLFRFGFLTIRLLDIIDITLVACLLYWFYTLVRGGIAIKIFVLILAVYLLWLVVKALNMQLLGSILGQFISVGIITLIIVFQQEIRRFLVLLGSDSYLSKNNFTKQFIPLIWRKDTVEKLNFTPVIKACKNLSQQKTGALIVLTKSSDLKFYINTGDTINAVLSKRLLENIFFKNSPLHDGAVIISNNYIKAARCVLPVTDTIELPAYMGMRHRAAIGITEQTDAIAIVVSEETGDIAVAIGGKIKSKLSPEQLEELVQKEHA